MRFFFRKGVLNLCYKLIKKLKLKQLPGALFYNNLEYLKVIVAGEEKRKYLDIEHIAFVRPGLYWFFGDDVVIYRHNESRALKADVIHLKWCRVRDLNMMDLVSMGAPFVVVNLKQDDLVEYMQRYISPDLNLDSAITVFYCKTESLRGAFLREIVATLELHRNLPAYPTE